MLYKTILNDGYFKFEEKKSIFIGFCKRVESEEEAKTFILETSKSQVGARHNVYAFVLGKDMLIQRYSDDGEPQGTAGIPILDVIKKNGLTDIIVVVTRYFGGILLGAGGLTRAYIKSASESIKSTNVVEKILGVELKINIDYDLYGKFQFFANERNIDFRDITYEKNISFRIRCDETDLKSLKFDIINLTSNKINIDVKHDVIYFKKDFKYYLKHELK